MNSSHTDQLSAAMRGSRNFRHGGGGGGTSIWQKKLTALFVCFGGGPNFSRGGGQLLTPYRNPNNLRFSRGVRTPWPLPSGSALGCYLFSFPVRKMMRSPLGLHICSFSCNFVVCFQSSPAIKSFLELTAWLLPGLSNILCNSSLHSSITQ